MYARPAKKVCSHVPAQAALLSLTLRRIPKTAWCHEKGRNFHLRRKKLGVLNTVHRNPSMKRKETARDLDRASFTMNTTAAKRKGVEKKASLFKLGSN